MAFAVIHRLIFLSEILLSEKCPECQSHNLTREPKRDVSPRILCYSCENQHVFSVDRSDHPKRWPVHIPFDELSVCEQCGSDKLSKVHDQKYPDKEGIARFVIYRCEKGHETNRRQIVVRGEVS